MASKNHQGPSGKQVISSTKKKQDKGKTTSTNEAYRKKNYKSSPSVFSGKDDDDNTLYQMSATSKPAGCTNRGFSNNKNLQHSAPNHQSNTKSAASTPTKSLNQPADLPKNNCKQAQAKTKINVYDKKNQKGSANSINVVSSQNTSSRKEDNEKSMFNIKQSPGYVHSNHQKVFRYPGPRVQTPRPVRNVVPYSSFRPSFQFANRFPHPQQNLFFPHGNIVRFQQRNFNVQRNIPRPPATCGNKALSFFVQNSQSHSTHCNEQKSENLKNAGTSNAIPNIKYRRKKAGHSSKYSKQSKKIQDKVPDCKKIRKSRNKACVPPKVSEPDTSNITPLLSFKKVISEPNENCNLLHFSDDDFENLSQNSIDSSVLQNFDLIDFSDENNTFNKLSDPFVGPLQSVDHSQLSQDFNLIDFSDVDSESSDDSDESDVTSEVSVNSSTVNSEINLSVPKPNIAKEAFISVFWDIENCNLPARKSVIDFANYVRQTFYEGRTEETFTAVCDVSILSNMIVRELEEASIISIHSSSSNKNAADKKIMSFLQKFQLRYRNTNSAIVLITSDSDFSQILCDMRYQHHIFINLICNTNTRQSLITAADKYEFFGDIMNKLPDRKIIDNMQHTLLVTNLPHMQPKLIKSSLSEKLKSFNCRIKFTNNTSAIEIIFKDHSICEKARAYLKGYYLGGKLLTITYCSKLSGDKSTAVGKKKKKKEAQSPSVNLEIINSSGIDPFNSLVNVSGIDPFNSLVNVSEIYPFSSVENASGSDPFSFLINTPKSNQFSLQVNDSFTSQASTLSNDLLSLQINAPSNDPFSSMANIPMHDSFGSLANAPKSDVFSSVDKKSTGNGATLCVFVSMHIGDMEYWKVSFEKIWNTSDFSLQWEGSSFDGYFLIHFKSLRKAQKAKKVLEKNQLNNQNAPRFLKLIKHEEDLCSLKVNMHNIEESNKRQIDEHIKIVEKKKLKYLRSHENVIKELKNSIASSEQGTSEAIHEKLNECNEQMETFIRFSKCILEKIKKLNIKSENLVPELNELLCDFTRECNCISSALPIYAKKDLILKKIHEHQVVIIRAETGSGKSTQLTQYLWRERHSFGNKKVICTQPRKIAAVSLAKHVCSQIGSKLGDIVGYQVGMSNKMSINTGVLYVTDFTMLKLLVDEGLNDISCVIIDEAHERTIYTDILLGMIKKYLPLYPHVKIIITSATIDTSIFCDYFSLTENSVLEISGRMFPVEDVFLEHNVKPDWDYFNKSIDTALEILTEGPGDILLFLVTPLETEKALESFNQKIKSRKDCKEIKVYNLHGKLDHQEQQKIFEKVPSGMRKVVFATNCAETSITIPGIRYVIDCGLVKESQYDATRNMNVLAVGFVSKSSAKQRRGRAGRTQPGKCYHLYSKADYELMADSSDPEILRINLGEALLKLMKMGISDPVQFDFVQSPPKSLLKSTMEQLLFLKAVDERSYLLTDLGKKMAVLPLEPRLCHLILKGFDNDLGYEALAIASLVTVSNTVFFRNSENKDMADKLKRRFCDTENDYLTYLDVYKEWVDVPKNRKSHWCFTNYINARSMKIAHDLICEITLILKRELSYKVTTKFKDNSKDSLLHIIFHSFFQNLAVYSGCSKFGYKSSSLSDRLLIHPGSSVSAFTQSNPQFVVYGTILKTSQSFMVNVCPVTKSMILDAKNMHDIKIDLKSLEDMIASVYCIRPLGTTVIVNNFIGKKGINRKELITKIKALSNSDLVEIDIDIPKGSVQIIGYGIKADEIEAVIAPIISAAQQKLLLQVKDICLFQDLFPVTANLVAGGIFTDIVLPGEFREVKVILNGEESINTIVEKLSICGPITEIREWKKYFKISFENPPSAKKALEIYSNESGFSLKSIEKTVSEINHDYRVFMSFLRRKCTGFAFITLEDSATVASITSALPPIIYYRGSLVSISRSKKSNDICISKLPADADKRDLEPLIVSHLPAQTKIKKFIIARLKPYDSSNAEMDSLRSRIHNLFAEFTYKENIKVILKKPSSKDFTWNATVYFKSALDGEIAVSVLKNRKSHADFVGSIMLEPTVQTYLYCNSEVFSVVKDEIEEALQFFRNDLTVGRSLDIIAVPRGTDRVEIKITSNNVSDLTDARRSIYTLISGDVIKFSNDLDKEKFFTDLGKTYLRELSNETKDCYIYQNMYSKTITIFGKVNACNIIKMQINSFLKAHDNEEFKEINLKTDIGSSILKELYKSYGFDFKKLKEECDVTDIQVNKYKQILTIQGNISSVLKCETIIQEVKKKMNSVCSDAVEELCPVCFDEVSEEKHRLEYCGHSYCVECLLHMLQNSEDIPLKCEKVIEDNGSEEPLVCNSLIVVTDLIWAFNGREALKKSLYRKFLHSFVESRDDISFCPSPDCPMVFRVTKDEMNIYKCHSCKNDICTRCEELYHSGMSCSLCQCLKSNKDYSLEVWMEEDPSNRKKCPSCSAPIEKNGGCTHMTCWKCKCHMCWLCLQVFPTGDLVYSHQPFCPKKSD